MLTFDARFTRETLDTGAVVFHAGDPGDSAYLVESGQVEVLLESEGVFKPVDLLGPGAMFGEIALLDRLPRSGTVRAVEPTVLMRIDRSFVDDLLRATDPVIQYLLRVLPAHQGLVARHPAVGQREDGLVVQFQLAVADRIGQVARQRQGAQRRRMQRVGSLAIA